MTKIIKFPTREVLKTRQVEINAELAKDNHVAFIEEMVEYYGLNLINKFKKHGFDLDDPNLEYDTMYDFMFIMDLLKASLERCKGYVHPLHKVITDAADAYYATAEDEELT